MAGKDNPGKPTTAQDKAAPPAAGQEGRFNSDEARYDDPEEAQREAWLRERHAERLAQAEAEAEAAPMGNAGYGGQEYGMESHPDAGGGGGPSANYVQPTWVDKKKD